MIFVFGSNADMPKVEAEPLVRDDEKAFEVLSVIKQTLDIRHSTAKTGDYTLHPTIVKTIPITYPLLILKKRLSDQLFRTMHRKGLD